MTDSTRTDILNRIALRANDSGDIGLMRLYLSIYPSREDYERAARNHIEFFAVLATEEFHRVWEERSSGTGIEFPGSTPGDVAGASERTVSADGLIPSASNNVTSAPEEK